MFQPFKRGVRVKALLNSSRVDRVKNNFQPCHISSLSVVCHLSSIWSTHVISFWIFSTRFFSRVHPEQQQHRIVAHMTFSSGGFLSFLPFVFDPGGKSHRFLQAVQDSRFRRAVSRLLLVWPTARSTFLPPCTSSNRSRVVRGAIGKALADEKKKMTNFIFSGCATVYFLLIYLRNVTNTRLRSDFAR